MRYLKNNCLIFHVKTIIFTAEITEVISIKPNTVQTFEFKLSVPGTQSAAFYHSGGYKLRGRSRVPILFLLRRPNTNRLKETSPDFHSLFFKDRTVHVFHKRDVLHLHYNALKSLKYKTKESLVNIL